MRVKCLTSSIDQLKDIAVRNRLSEWIHLDGPDDNLIIGKCYPVIALMGDTIDGFKVCLHTVDKSDYPYPYPIEFFEVIDSTFPDNSCIGVEQGPSGKYGIRISFAEWANDDQFYERLVDGEEKAMLIYNKHKVEYLSI
jgi:hypothetical protein